MLFIKSGISLAVLGAAVAVFHYLEYQKHYSRPVQKTF